MLRLGSKLASVFLDEKEHPILTRKDFMGNHEDASMAGVKGAGHKFFGPNNVPDVWSVKKISPQWMIHPDGKTDGARRPGDAVFGQER